ncbi:uncharacterized protein LOC131245167 [Magnolia sinica]|uniref:uncharacterized protein LOC131245167 n=1 Tax=Magnolia sinica TaxID=86752 RepID=UPI00265B56C9|nr:uncharacterized protein LOC131245167 [Magnolia sinica]
MATKPAMTTEAIALTEKKMDMTLDDIIKMSKKSSSKSTTHRPSNKSRGFLNTGNAGASRGNTAKVQRFMDSRSSLRQGVLAQRRSNFLGKNQFPLAKEAARKAAFTPFRNRALIRNRMVNWDKSRVAAPPVQRNTAESAFVGGRVNVVPKQRPQTLDSLFANMKEQRMRVLSQQQTRGGQNVRRRGAQQQQQQQQMRGGGRGYRAAGVRPFGNFAK